MKHILSLFTVPPSTTHIHTIPLLPFPAPFLLLSIMNLKAREAELFKKEILVNFSSCSFHVTLCPTKNVARHLALQGLSH